MITIYFKGRTFIPNNIKTRKFFKDLQTLTENGKISKFGFKNRPAAKFGMAKVIIEDKYDNNIDKLLFETIRSLKRQLNFLRLNKVKAITIYVKTNTSDELNFSITKELILISDSIELEVHFEITPELNKTTEDFIKKNVVLLGTFSGGEKKINRESLSNRRINRTQATTLEELYETMNNPRFYLSKQDIKALSNQGILTSVSGTRPSVINPFFPHGSKKKGMKKIATSSTKRK